MRIPLRDERGGAAIIVAICTVVLVGVTAFVADFGLAYASKRQLQTGADAASLAAASVYAGYPGTCTTLQGNTAARAVAQQAANDVLAANKSDVLRPFRPITVRCEDGTLKVRYSANGRTPILFGSAFGFGGEITTGRTAVAQVFVPESVTGLRPYAICHSDIGTVGGPLTKVSYPGEDCQEANGGWYQLVCPGDTPSSNRLAVNTANGCSSPVSIVEGQPDRPADPSSVLIGACTAWDEDCLRGNPGNDFSSNTVRKAWETLLGEEIVLPAFYDGTIQDPNGSNARYPVHRLLGVRVCGYHWGASGSHDPDLNDNQGEEWADTQDGSCAGTDAEPGGNGENYLILRFIRIQLSGSSNPADCRLGSGCDGLREVRLVE